MLTMTEMRTVTKALAVQEALLFDQRLVPQTARGCALRVPTGASVWQKSRWVTREG